MTLPVPAGLGADSVLDEQLETASSALADLQRFVAERMAARERAAAAAAQVNDVRGDAVQAGMDPARARLLRRVGLFAQAHRAVALAWHEGQVRLEQVELLRAGAARVGSGRAGELVEEVLPLLPGLPERESRALIAVAVDQLRPGDPDSEERAEHAARRLSWSRVPRGGLTFEGYLPAAEATAFTAAINALAESLRVAGDGITAAQRRADGLAALVAAAAERGLPSAGGLPAVLSLTVSLTEAARIVEADPGLRGSPVRHRTRGEASIDGEVVGEATVRFAMCCAAITPILTDQVASAGASGDHPELGSLLHRIARSSVQPLALGRSVRLATAAQRHALRLRDRGCVIPGCDVEAATQPHHVTAWSVGGRTDLDAMVSLCWVHHRLTELGRFTFHPKVPGGPRPEGALEHPTWWILPPPPTRPRARARAAA